MRVFLPIQFNFFQFLFCIYNSLSLLYLVFSCLSPPGSLRVESAESIFCRQCFTDDNAHVYLTRKVFIRLYENILESPGICFGSRLLIELCAASESFCNLLGPLSLIAGDGGQTLSPAVTTSILPALGWGGGGGQ